MQQIIAKIGDFNVSIKQKQRGVSVLSNTGTPYYASPEIWTESECSEKSDIWSLGCVLYEMAALRVPFKGSDMKILKNRILAGKFVSASQKYSKSVHQMIFKLL